MTEVRPSPWARPRPGQAPAEIALTVPGPPEILESPSAPAPAPVVGARPVVPAPRVAGTGERHPQDPDETTSSKATAVLALGIVGVLLMFCGGGLVPGVAGLLMVRTTRTEIAAAAGFLTGGRALRAGEILSWVAVAVSAVVIVAVVIGLLIGSVGSGPQYDENVN
ncbi:hypothetical protein [Cryptosporangium sp. NPDC051539]|uniref:hypothetical protein n=1 Tax=Cryptosporangium sp. NPDC051539 TaxID=3363962 RepID=UPI0037ABEC9F